jgi:DNA invertase Pin-like site-specific DNA recombinase
LCRSAKTSAKSEIKKVGERLVFLFFELTDRFPLWYGIFKMKTMIAYYRVSTQRQGIDGYGMTAQKEIVSRFITAQNANLIGEFSEVETGKNNDRPELAKALALASNHKATLVIAKLDRLSRNAAFLLTLQNAGCDFVCCDCPNADRFTIGILALVAQRERELISERTKLGMAVAKSKGARIGTQNPEASVKAMIAGAKRAKIDFAHKMAKILGEIQTSGVQTLQGIATCLNRRGYATRTGKKWFASSVRNLIAAIAA